jgi:hypothetical protein
MHRAVRWTQTNKKQTNKKQTNGEMASTPFSSAAGCLLLVCNVTGVSRDRTRGIRSSVFTIALAMAAWCAAEQTSGQSGAGSGAGRRRLLRPSTRTLPHSRLGASACAVASVPAALSCRAGLPARFLLPGASAAGCDAAEAVVCDGGGLAVLLALRGAGAARADACGCWTSWLAGSSVSLPVRTARSVTGSSCRTAKPTYNHSYGSQPAHSSMHFMHPLWLVRLTCLHSR